MVAGLPKDSEAVARELSFIGFFICLLKIPTQNVGIFFVLLRKPLSKTTLNTLDLVNGSVYTFRVTNISRFREMPA
jgi:hypothetical protein